MRKAMLIFGILLLLLLPVPSAQAITWHMADQATVGWTAPTKFASGLDIPASVTLEYEVFTAMKPDKSDIVSAGRAAELSKLITMDVEGRHYCGVRAIRVENSEDVSCSAIAWSDDPAVCKNGETFGIQFYLVPDVPCDLYKK